MTFSKDMIEAAGGDWDEAVEANEELDALRKQRVSILPLEGPLRRSKIAWKISVLRQSLTYRLVDLADASVAQWNEGNSLACIILARAFMETVAVLHFVENRMRKALVDENLEELNRLAMQASFGGRHPYWQTGNTDPAISVMTALDHMSREAPGARDFYERISEIVHPNSQGTHQFYSTTDKERIEVSFSRDKRGRRDILPHLMAALVGVPWATAKLADIDGMIPQVAGLQNPEK